MYVKMLVSHGVCEMTHFCLIGWQDDSSKTEQLKFSKDFIKKMEEWERIKGLSEHNRH